MKNDLDNSPPIVSRRTLLIGASTLAAASAMGFGPAAFAAVRELRWLTWGTYFSDDYLAGFAEEANTELVVGAITNNDDQFAMLKAGGTSEWDVWDAENAMCQLHIQNGLVKPLDFSRIPNASMLFPHLRNASWTMGEDGQPYFICHVFGIETIAYRADLIDKPTSWNVLFDPNYAGKITQFDYALDAINIAGLALFGRENYSKWTPEQLAAIKDKLIEQKRLVRAYWASEADCRDLFLNGEVVVGQSWVPTALALKDEGLAVELVLPDEGAIGWSDNLAISSAISPEAEDQAYQLINFLMGEAYGLKINRGGPYTTGTTHGWVDKLSEEERSMLFLDQQELLSLSNYRFLPPDYDEWTQLWDEIKLS